MRGDEARVVGQFTAWLVDRGFTVETEVDFCDVVAEKDGQVIYAEAKGRTAALGLDVDTTYGQLLRRMKQDLPGGVRYALVVPDEALHHALRVPERVRQLLSLDVYTVSAGGEVVGHGPGPSPG